MLKLLCCRDFLVGKLFGMVALNIPLHLQKLGSEDCGPISSLMILDYFGITSDPEEVIAKVPRHSFGTSSFDNATTMIDYGLKVHMITAQPLLFDGDFIRSNPTRHQITSRVEEAMRKEKDQGKKDTLNGLIVFIEAGGSLSLEYPSKESIVTALNDGKPVFASMFTNTIGRNQGGYHFVVIGGYKDEQFLIFNPWQPSRQKSWENADEILFGIHCSTLFDYDNGTILIVDK